MLPLSRGLSLRQAEAIVLARCMTNQIIGMNSTSRPLIGAILRPPINRQTSSAINPFLAFAIDEVTPQEGDIVVKSRNGSGATWNDFISKETHGDIVIDVSPTDITVIGGNVSDTVKQKTFPLNDNGFVNSTGGANSHFAIVRINV